MVRPAPIIAGHPPCPLAVGSRCNKFAWPASHPVFHGMRLRWSLWCGVRPSQLDIPACRCGRGRSVLHDFCMMVGLATIPRRLGCVAVVPAVRRLPIAAGHPPSLLAVGSLLLLLLNQLLPAVVIYTRALRAFDLWHVKQCQDTWVCMGNRCPWDNYPSLHPPSLSGTSPCEVGRVVFGVWPCPPRSDLGRTTHEFRVHISENHARARGGNAYCCSDEEKTQYEVGGMAGHGVSSSPPYLPPIRQPLPPHLTGGMGWLDGEVQRFGGWRTIGGE